MNCQTFLPKLARTGIASFLFVAMVGLSAGDAAGQVECSDVGVANGTLDAVSFAAGAHVVEDGAGLNNNDHTGTASVNVPAGATIVDAYVYWAIRQVDGEPDGEIEFSINGETPVEDEGDCIGFDEDGDEGPSGTAYAFKLALPTDDLNAGAVNTLELTVLDEEFDRADGFSLVILYTLDGSTGFSAFYEGVDFIWEPVDPSSSLEITGDILEQCSGSNLTLHLKVGDVEPDRPHRLTIDIDGSTFLEKYNFFGDLDADWESQWSDRGVIIGSGNYDETSTIEIELASEENPDDPNGGEPSSLTWVVAGATCSTSDEVAGCTRTPGYWKNQGFRSGVLSTALASAILDFPDAFDGDLWPDDLSDEAARDILNQNDCTEMTFCLEKHLLAAILNVANGATNTVADTIEDAIDLLVSGGSADAEDLKDTLDSFNNGLEGTPSCDSLEEEEEEEEENGPSSLLSRGALKHSVGPNPFNPATQIHFVLDESMPVRLSVYDVLGREVRTLIDESLNAGEHRVHFDANGLPTGTYFYRFVTPQGVFGGQMILLK